MCFLYLYCFCFFFFKQKTAYEIRLSLVGSEMCIRDRGGVRPGPGHVSAGGSRSSCGAGGSLWLSLQPTDFLCSTQETAGRRSAQDGIRTNQAGKGGGVSKAVSPKARFFEQDAFIVLGDSSGGRFPKFTWKCLQANGKQVYPVDLGSEADGAPSGTMSSLDEVPENVTSAVVEVSKERTAGAVETLMNRGITDLWIHQRTDTPEALQAAHNANATVHHGDCAVMYLAPTASPHALHRGLWKLLGRY